MGTTKVLNGIQHVIPDTGDFDWGDEMTPAMKEIFDLLSGEVSALKLLVNRIASPWQPITAVGGTTPLDFALGYNLRIVLQASTTLTFANPRDGERYVFQLFQDGTGGRLVTWPAAVDFGGVTPTLSVTPNKVDVVGMIYDSASGKYRAELRTGYGP